MKNFLFKSPTKIIFGAGEALNIGELCRQLNCRKPFLVTDRVIERLSAFQEIADTLKKEGMEGIIYSDTVVDPPVEVVDNIAGILKRSGCDVVIAVGGGSSIDTAKAVSMLVTNEGSVKEYLFGGTRTVKNPALPLIAVPTTAGSGSEVTAACVITDTENNIKLSVTHEYIIPRFSVVDPMLHMAMPGFITATTGMDALTHAIEAYVSLNANLITDAYACKAMELIASNIRTAMFNPLNLEARSNMAIASVLAATAFVHAGLGAVHGISQAIGGVAHVAHGLANSMMLPHVMETNFVGNLEKFATVVKLLGERTEGLSLRDQAEQSVKAINKLVDDLRIPRSLSEVKVTREMFPTIVKGTMEYRLLACNPVTIRDQDVMDILEKAY